MINFIGLFIIYMTYPDIEELFIRADKAIDKGNIAEGKKMLEMLIQEEPSFGRAHNHLGWIYKTKYNDFEQAEKHYNLAIKFESKYPHSYINYAVLLREMHRFEEARQILKKTLSVPGINKTAVFDEYGSLYELEGKYNLAIKNYKKAISFCLVDSVMEDLKNSIRRCKYKNGLFSKFNLFKRV